MREEDLEVARKLGELHPKNFPRYEEWPPRKAAVAFRSSMLERLECGAQRPLKKHRPDYGVGWSILYGHGIMTARYRCEAAREPKNLIIPGSMTAFGWLDPINGWFGENSPPSANGVRRAKAALSSG